MWLLGADIPEILTRSWVFDSFKFPVVHRPVNAPCFLREFRAARRDSRQFAQMLMHAWMHGQIAAEPVSQVREVFTLITGRPDLNLYKEDAPPKRR